MRLLLATALAFAAAIPVAAQTAAPLAELSLEELGSLEVTSASRRLRKLSESANAVYVITRDDIRRSGASSLPDVLGMAPGLHVAHIDGNKWAVGVRGFNDRWSNKLLVLVDGRSVYTPLFSGVFWEVEDLPLEDIDRIEVIRGPGATMWGANAVNGVINIITRSATTTTGTVVSGAAGSGERVGDVRYGAELGAVGAFRAFLRSANRDAFTLGGRSAQDDSAITRGGGRVDLFPAAPDTISVSSEVYRAEFGSPTTAPVAPQWPSPARQPRVPASGGFVLASWKHALSSSASFALQSSYDHSYRGDHLATERRDTVDVDFQHQFNTGRRHEYIWGATYRRSTDDLQGTYALSVPEQRQLRMFSAFGQTDLALRPDQLRLTLGTRVEHHNVAGLEVLPNVRLLWTRGAQSAWTSVSRAVKNPSRIELDMRVVTRILPPGALFTGSPLAEVASTGTGSRATPESVVAYEAGYRVRPARQLSFDLATFYNRYDRLLSRRAGTPYLETAPLRMVVPFALSNTLAAESYGAELAGEWRPSARVRVAGWVSERRFVFEQSQYVLALMLAENNPRTIGSLRTYVTLPGRVDVAPALSYTGVLKSGVDAHAAFDLSATWRATPHLDVSLVGRDLLRESQPQFTPTIDGGLATDVPRVILVKSVVRF